MSALDFHGSDSLRGAALHGQSGQLLNLAASGQGMHRLASTLWGTGDWSLAHCVFHEAGHGVAASACGEHAEIRIYSPTRGECRHWLPQAGAHRPVAHRRLISLAGPIAGELARYGMPYTLVRMQRTLASMEFSPSDRIGAQGFGLDDTRRAFDLVLGNWDAVAELASRAHGAYLGAVAC